MLFCDNHGVIPDDSVVYHPTNGELCTICGHPVQAGVTTQ